MKEGSRILLADDDQDFVRALTRILTYSGYQVEKVGSGREALLAIRRARPA
ncbi:MAG: response regulator, partial [Chloroflexi bacterium]|nr:response regulator [Chloroflexota bacterium]